MSVINGMVTINFKQTKPAYLVTGIALLAAAVSELITQIIYAEGIGESLSLGNYPLIFPLLLAIMIPAGNYSKLMNLGGTRKNFFKSCPLNYAAASLAAAILCLILRLTDPLISIHAMLSWNLLDVFGFMRHGAVIAVLQMACFLFFWSCAAHTLTMLQGRWYGWVIDAAIITLISLLGLRPIQIGWGWLFHMLIFNNLAFAQIAFCIIAGTAIYAASLPPLKAKRIGS
jgi:hypothetical protein